MSKKKDVKDKIDNYKKQTTLIRISRDTKESLAALDIDKSMNSTIKKLIEAYSNTATRDKE